MRLLLDLSTLASALQPEAWNPFHARFSVLILVFCWSGIYTVQYTTIFSKAKIWMHRMLLLHLFAVKLCLAEWVWYSNNDKMGNLSYQEAVCNGHCTLQTQMIPTQIQLIKSVVLSWKYCRNVRLVIEEILRHIILLFQLLTSILVWVALENSNSVLWKTGIPFLLPNRNSIKTVKQSITSSHIRSCRYAGVVCMKRVWLTDSCSQCDSPDLTETVVADVPLTDCCCLLEKDANLYGKQVPHTIAILILDSMLLLFSK